MNRFIFSILLTVGVLATASAVYAQGNQIYTWTDENGVIHYTDTVPDNPNAASMEAPEAYFPGSGDAYPDQGTADIPAADGTVREENIVSEPADSEQVSSAGGSGNEELSYAEQKRRELAQHREERRKEQADRERRCADAKAQIAMMEPHRRVFFTNDEGETERMDDEVRVARVEEAKAQAAEYCD